VSEERFKGHLLLDQFPQLPGIKARQPLYDLVQLFLCSAFLLYLFDVQRVDRGEGAITESCGSTLS
jgi:hypothetical protein